MSGLQIGTYFFTERLKKLIFTILIHSRRWIYSSGDMYILPWTDLDWTGLYWALLDWTGIDWTGLNFGLDWTRLDWDWTGIV